MTRQMPIIVSHYTLNTGYEQEVKNLIASLKRLDLQYDVEAIEILESWRANSNWCSVLVQKMLNKYPDRDILRVDADAVFQRFPDLFLRDDFKADVAAHIHDFPWCFHELMGGTIFFRNKPNVRKLVDRWAHECMINSPMDRNGILLQKLIVFEKFDVKFGELPGEYCKIFDMMQEVAEAPVIEHFQASRRLKKKINKEGTRMLEAMEDVKKCQN